MKGKSIIDQRAKIEYLAQHQLEQLDPDGTPLQTMVDRYPGDKSNTHIGELRRYLANFGLGGEVLPVQKIHTMSEYRRLLLLGYLFLFRNVLVCSCKKRIVAYTLPCFVVDQVEVRNAEFA